MKIKVRTPFTDKYTGTVYQTGDELDVSVERINEILSVGNFIELAEPTEQTEGQAAGTPPTADQEQGSEDEAAPKGSTRSNRK